MPSLDIKLLDSPEARYATLERLVRHNAALNQADASDAPAPLKLIRKLPHWAGNALEMAQLFLMAPNYQAGRDIRIDAAAERSEGGR